MTGTGDAKRILTHALAADPELHLAAVAIALTNAMDGEPYSAPMPTRRLHRWERQHGEIIRVAMTGDAARAADLRREHLVEYPTDLLIAWLPAADR